MTLKGKLLKRTIEKDREGWLEREEKEKLEEHGVSETRVRQITKRKE